MKNIKTIAFIVFMIGAVTVSAQRRTNGNRTIVIEKNLPTNHVGTGGVVKTKAKPVNHNAIRLNQLRFSNRHNNNVSFRYGNRYGVDGIVLVRNINRGFGYNTLNQDRYNEWLQNQYEIARAHRLYKYTIKPSKKNTRKLIRYNILTGRNSEADINK